MREDIYGRPSVAGRCSAVGVDTNKDSGCRRRVAIKVFAAGADYPIIGGQHGAAVSGADPVERHLHLTVMLDCVEADRVRWRRSRTPRASPARRRHGNPGVPTCVGAPLKARQRTCDNLTATDDPPRVMMRQVAGAFAEYEKAPLVQTLRGSRAARRAPYAEMR